MKRSKKLGFNRFMLENPWEIGRLRLEKANLKATREGARKRLNRNLRTKREINNAVRTSRDAPAVSIGIVDEVEMPTYANRIMDLYSEFYEE